MKSSYRYKITNMNKCIKDTIQIYDKAVDYLVDIAIYHYDKLSQMDSANERRNYFEKLIHTTKNSKAKYNGFDKKFHKFPCYFRRCALVDACTSVFNWMEQTKQWEENGKITKKPKLKRKQHYFPCFYHKDMFVMDGNTAKIKVFHQNDWKWFDIKLRNTDYKHFNKKLLNSNNIKKIHAPIIVKHNKHYELQFAVHFSSKNTPKFLKDKDVTKALGVDLGVNTDAVCSALTKDGTVTGSLFVNSPVEKDRLYKLLNVIRKSQQHGNFKNRRLWRFVKNYNKQIAITTAKQIVSFAVSQNVNVIVLEYFNFVGKLKGSKKQKISMWRKREIQKRITAMAKQFGIRVAYVCPYNTSKLAFDGSGEVTRGRNANLPNNKLCRFSNGKIYNCDLSASKNIVARYFIRCLKKSISEKKWLSLEAKVPYLDKRTYTTLSTLISINAVLSNLSVA